MGVLQIYLIVVPSTFIYCTSLWIHYNGGAGGKLIKHFHSVCSGGKKVIMGAKYRYQMYNFFISYAWKCILQLYVYNKSWNIARNSQKKKV